jgi:hypothetical protein
MTNYYDVARMANTMAMKTTIVLDPTQITVRVKNSVKKQLRSGFITTGWRSHAGKIAEAITQKFELPVSRVWWRGLQVNNPCKDTRQFLLGLVEADWAAEILERPYLSNNKYYRERFAEQTSNLRGANASFHLTFHDRAYADEAREYLGRTLSAAQREQIEKAIDVLDNTDPIHITTY